MPWVDNAQDYRELIKAMLGVCIEAVALKVFFAAQWFVAMAIFSFLERVERDLFRVCPGTSCGIA